MRSPVADLKTLHYAQRIETKAVNDGEVTGSFGDPLEFKATVNAPRGEVTAAIYGAKLPYVRVLNTGSMRLAEGTGVWLEAATTGKPDYVVIADRSTARQNTCDIGKRGQFGG